MVTTKYTLNEIQNRSKEFGHFATERQANFEQF